MIREATILRVERLRDELQELQRAVREKYSRSDRQVTGSDIRDTAARLAEAWMVEVKRADGVRVALDATVLADLDVEFQRLLSHSEHGTLRKKYDSTLRAILRDFRARVVVPLKQAARDRDGVAESRPQRLERTFEVGAKNTIFLAHSFADVDRPTVEIVRRLLIALGWVVTSGEKPRAARISDKVKARIDGASVFLGLFTRRDKIARRKEWVTSPWLIDEKAHAYSKGKRLVLLKELGVNSIGGLQGDYEYIEFDRGDMTETIVRLVELLVGEDD